MPAEVRVLHDACAMHVPKAEPDAPGACQHHRSVSFLPSYFFFLANHELSHVRYLIVMQALRLTAV